MTPIRNRRRGKNHQRRIAKDLMGLNIGITGDIDVLTGRFAIECKSRKNFVGVKWFEQALRGSIKHGKIPLVVVHVLGKRYENDFVLIRLKDFMNLVKGGDKVCQDNNCCQGLSIQDLRSARL